ncbi:hypothetical protein CPB86DRAFT_104412 [Serendipita vermifera]|nr:hypothetical protein CPB86DRAFT_104412 [Serendipita vermifera]
MGPKCEDLIRRRYSLTHINIQSENTLVGVTMVNLLPFRNLRHLGEIWLRSFTCPDRCQELCAILRRLTAFQSLVSVHARYKYPQCSDCGHHIEAFRSGLAVLPGLFPNLVRVFLMRIEWGHSHTTWDIWRFSNVWHLEMRDHRMDEEMMIRDWPGQS